MRVLEPVDFDLTVKYLVDSVTGIVNGKPCHLYPLLLRSLRDYHDIGTAGQHTRLPSGMAESLLCLSEEYLVVFAMGCPRTIFTHTGILSLRHIHEKTLPILKIGFQQSWSRPSDS